MSAARPLHPVSHLIGAAALALALFTVACEDDDPVIGRDGSTQDMRPPDSAGDAATTDAAADMAAGDAKLDGAGTTDGGTGDAADAAPTDAPPTAPAPNVVYAAVRFNADGTLDTTFGTGGIARVALGAGANALQDPAIWGLAKDGTDNLYLFGQKRHETRTDNERAVAKLTTNGALDASFGTGGFFTFGLQALSDSARGGVVQADGKIVSAGYTAQPTGVGTQSVNRIMLARALPTGMIDTSFGVGGVVNSAPFMPSTPDALWGMAEAYGVAVQTNGSYVTTGYGWRAPAPPPATSTPVDVVSFRYGADGKRDLTWGGTTDGTVVLSLNVEGGNDRGRNVLTLADDRVVIVGTGTVSISGNTGTEDALVVMLTPTGAYDTTFGTGGYKLFDFMAVDEEFYGVARSPNNSWVAAVGYRAGVVGQDDDATVLLEPLTAGAGTEVAKALPLSETANDRLWAVAFGADNLVYAAGYIQEGSDRWMAVARIKTDGTLDTSFGTGGIAKVNVATAGTVEAARGIVVQASGKIVIAGPAEAP
jgi:uncharacterized delta-60 repeat protein